MTTSVLRQCILLILLVLCSPEDIRTQQIPVLLPAAGIAAGIFLNLACRDMSWGGMAAGIAAGGVMILLSGITKGAVGSGDGWMIAASGALTGFLQSLTVMMSALFLMMTVSAVLLLLQRKKCTDTLPFIPFFLAADLIFLAAA